MKITDEMFAQHDCHLSPEDSCSACERYYSQPFVKDELLDANEVPVTEYVF
jgi:hypothetical protein